MILPTKHIAEHETILGVGAAVLNHLSRPRTISELWDRLRDDRTVGTYERFILALDLLYILGAIRFADGLLRKNRR